MSLATAPVAALQEALLAALAFEAVGERAGNVQPGSGRLDGRAVRVALIENRQAGGSIGGAEAACLAALFKVAAVERSPLVLWIDSAGAKVSEGLRALGGFRGLYRAGLDAAMHGTPIAAVLGRNCYGGASMLAHLAPQRLLSPATQLAMSGPAVIASASGLSALDEGFRAMAQAALSPASRAKANAANTLWAPDVDVAGWLRAALAPPGAAADAWRARHEGLAARIPAKDPQPGSEAVRRRDLERIYEEYEARESQGLLEGSGRRAGAQEAFAGLVGKQPLGVHRAWRFAEAIWRLAADPPARLEVFLDCASHAARLEEERVVQSEFIVDMGLALRSLAAAGCRVGLTVAGQAGGGVYVALAAPAERVATIYGAADVQVLPGSAVAAILGESRAATPSFADYRAAGVADEEIKLGIVPNQPT
jgi:hypothetical protein